MTAEVIICNGRGAQVILQAVQHQERDNKMRNTTEITRGYQFWYMLRRELIGLCICAFIEFVLFTGAYSNDIFRNISGVLFAIINFFIIFDSAAGLSKLDMKSYTPLKYDVKWSVLWGLMIGFISLLWILIFKLNWHFGVTDGVLSNPISIVLNILFFIWNAPYMAFMLMVPKTVPAGVVLVSFILPVIASFTGYISGKKDFTISDKLRNLMFEKKE